MNAAVGISPHDGWARAPLAASFTTDVAIIGAGATGMIAAIALNRLAPWLHVTLVDGGSTAGRGLSYGTPYGAHLLNVPASGMSAIQAEPDHFARWLAATLPGSGPQTFAPRALYGDYLAETLAGGPDPRQVEHVGASALRLSRDSQRFQVTLDDGRSIACRVVVLALGNFAPADPFGGEVRSPRYVQDPWAPGFTAGLGEHEPVLLLGTGLTMVDTVLTLRTHGHRGQIHALSRHGTLPGTHLAYAPGSLPELPAGPSPRGVIGWVRRRAAAHVREGGDWRAVIDGLRPHAPGLWQRWTPAERGSFLRHARWAWDVHRHRMAPEVGGVIDRLVAAGTLRVAAGRVRRVSESPNAIAVSWAERGSGRRHWLRVGRIVNCTGPCTDYRSLDNALVRHLREVGWLRPDPHGLGIETDGSGQLLDQRGLPVRGLLTIGPPRRAGLFESTAVPEIRTQATRLAHSAIDLVDLAEDGGGEGGPGIRSA